MRIPSFLFLVFFAFCVAGANGQGCFDYTLILTDKTFHILHDTSAVFHFSIYADTVWGNPIYTETDTAVSNKFGIIDVPFGTKSSLSQMDWNTQKYFLKVVYWVKNENNFIQKDIEPLIKSPFSPCWKK
jgi:hypothetical protein